MTHQLLDPALREGQYGSDRSSVASNTQMPATQELSALSHDTDALWEPIWAEVMSRQGVMWTIKDAASGRYLFADPLFAAWLGQTREGLLGSSDAEHFDGDVVVALRAAEQTACAHRAVLSSEHRFERAGVRHEFLVLRSVGAPDEAGRRRLISVWIDRQAERLRESQLRNALEQLEQQQRANDALRKELAHQGALDAASGLYSRAHFEDQLRREVDLSTREHREFALVLLEIDEPSAEVQALGEEARARILSAMGQLLRSNTRAMDASCRLDDRRFAVLLSGVGLATAHSRVEGLRRQCATQIVVFEGRELGFTASMGVASFPHTAHSQEELTTASEAALNEARRRGGNHVTLASISFDGV